MTSFISCCRRKKYFAL